MATFLSVEAVYFL